MGRSFTGAVSSGRSSPRSVVVAVEETPPSGPEGGLATRRGGGFVVNAGEARWVGQGGFWRGAWIEPEDGRWRSLGFRPDRSRPRESRRSLPRRAEPGGFPRRVWRVPARRGGAGAAASAVGRRSLLFLASAGRCGRPVRRRDRRGCAGRGASECAPSPASLRGDTGVRRSATRRAPPRHARVARGTGPSVSRERSAQASAAGEWRRPPWPSAAKVARRGGRRRWRPRHTRDAVPRRAAAPRAARRAGMR